MLLAPDSEGVQAAAEPVNSPELAKRIYAQVRRAEAFQVLLDVQIKRQVPVRTEMRATRILEFEK
jgi:hypothetical protein